MARSGLAALAATLLVAALFGSDARGVATGGPQAPRLLYTSDWSGPSGIYALDPSGRTVPGQVAAGFDPLPSPDGRRVLFSDCAGSGPSLFVARADGGQRRRLARSRRSCFFAYLSAAWAPDSRRIAYTIDDRVHVVNADGSGHRVVSPSYFDIGLGAELAWSPDGRALAFRADSGSLQVLSNGSLRSIGYADDFSWSPSGTWIAYERHSPSELDLVRQDGRGRRRLAPGPVLDGPEWSADGRFVAFRSLQGIEVVDLKSGGVRHLTDYTYPQLLEWTPASDTIAATSSEGLALFDLDKGESRLLTADRPLEARWSPDGRSLAYVVATASTPDYDRGDLRVVSLAGGVHTIVAAAGDYGGLIGGLVWTRPAAGVRYRPAARRSVAAVSPGQLVAPWAITRLAADGGRVAYVSCGHVFVWAPATGNVVQAEPVASLSPRCTIGTSYIAFQIYSLALAGDRIAFGARQGNMGQMWHLYSGVAGATSPFLTLDSVYSANGCAVGSGGLGDLAGSGDLLVYSRWSDDGRCPATTVAQQIHRVEPDGCACPTIASSAGPLVPFDVDGGRIVDGGSNATEIRDRAGALLLSVPVSPLAAQLSGGDLVVLVQGALRDYDASTGALLHAWPVADVPSAGECGSPHSGTWECHNDARLVLEDSARGLVTYVLDGRVHLLRLVSGADSDVGAGTLARFTDAGLVYASRDHLLFVPDGQLPR